MQFHLNGFRAGDPDVADAYPASAGPRPDGLPEEVDVLVVGCGPAGLTLAAQLSAFPGITTRIVERKAGPLELGQADGVACRTMEMFNAFGFAGRVMREAYWVNETTFWKPDAAEPSRITRNGRVQDVEDGLSEFPHVILNQARVHDFYLDVMRRAPRRLIPDYGRRLKELSIDRSGRPTHPVTVVLEREGGAGGATETVKARYVVGCDGARSTVRRCLGRELRGDSANQAWGVMDVLAVTDFPDIRYKALIQSSRQGSIVLIPREGGYLVRIYVEMDKLAHDERASNRGMVVDDLVAAARRIIHPYALDVKEVAWWSVYEIGQRLCDRFDDLADAEAATGLPHVFIAGDACHTHSPKAGQGMNVSMQDTFNLGWKLASVLQGTARPELLRSYSEERQAVARELIDFDREWAAMLSAPIRSEPDGEGVDPAEVRDHFVRHGRYTAGTATRYRDGVLVGDTAHQHLAQRLTIGMRFHSAPVVRLGDGRPMQLGHCAPADGRWRLYAFSDDGDPAFEGSAIRGLCDFLADSPRSPILRHTPPGADLDTVIDLRAVFQQHHHALDIAAMPALLLPAKGRYGLRDYEKMFCADHTGTGDIFEMRGIDRGKGCIVVARPDQYVAHVLPLDGTEALCAFFGEFMISHR